MADIDKYLQMMLEHGASDLHLCTGSKPVFRKDGSIIRLREDEIDIHKAKGRRHGLITLIGNDTKAWH